MIKKAKVCALDQLLLERFGGKVAGARTSNCRAGAIFQTSGISIYPGPHVLQWTQWIDDRQFGAVVMVLA